MYVCTMLSFLSKVLQSNCEICSGYIGTRAEMVKKTLQEPYLPGSGPLD